MEKIFTDFATQIVAIWVVLEIIVYVLFCLLAEKKNPKNMIGVISFFHTFITGSCYFLLLRVEGYDGWGMKILALVLTVVIGVIISVLNLDRMKKLYEKNKAV